MHFFSNSALLTFSFPEITELRPPKGGRGMKVTRAREDLSIAGKYYLQIAREYLEISEECPYPQTGEYFDLESPTFTTTKTPSIREAGELARRKERQTCAHTQE